MKRVNALVLGLAVLLAFGCSGDEPEPESNQTGNPGNQTCVPLTHYSAAINGHFDYAYNAAGQLTKANLTYPGTGTPKGFYDLVGYNSKGQIYKIRQYQVNPPDVYLGYKILTYTPGSLLEKVTTYGSVIASDTTNMQPLQETAYEYDAQKRLTKVTNYPPGQSSSIHSFTTFTYQPDGKVLETNFGPDASQLYFTRLYQFNNLKTPGGTVAYLNLYENKASYSDNILFGRLPEVVLEKKYAPGNSTTPVQEYTFSYSYTFNPDGYPTSQTITVTGRPGQQPITHTWTYNCQ